MTIYDDDMRAYIATEFAPEDRALVQARVDSPKYGLPAINIEPEEGRFLEALVAACRPQLAVEIGTLGGYSGIWIARGLPPGGKLITIDISEEHAAVARKHFDAAGIGDRIETIVGNAHQVLEQLVHHGPFGFVFIDAEKPGYPDYYAWAVENVKPGGAICAHNAFSGGRILAPNGDDHVESILGFNRMVAQDNRVVSTIFPAGDGTLIAVKR